ncbi:Invertase inhibitor [Rhynchospora pubera]|uniref:Invertase inhibitor n=1 Tax=Rhynchospora pubera TaxID=906938 RepID=A0AAV8F3P8_9POAL|nr:Invertase inhibitor [Rhynchospora pubera]
MGSLRPLLFYVILLSYHPFSRFAAASTVDDVCEKTMVDGHVTKKECYSVINSDPRSRTADLHGIAVISGDIAIKTATSLIPDVYKFLKASSDPNQQKERRKCFQTCTDVIPMLNGAAELVKSKNYGQARKVFVNALIVPKMCYDLTENHPLRGLIERFITVVSVAFKVSELAHG